MHILTVVAKGPKLRAQHEALDEPLPLRRPSGQQQDSHETTKRRQSCSSREVMIGQALFLNALLRQKITSREEGACSQAIGRVGLPDQGGICQGETRAIDAKDSAGKVLASSSHTAEPGQLWARQPS